MGYVDEVLEVVKKKNADQPEFLQAVTEVLDSLRPVTQCLFLALRKRTASSIQFMVNSTEPR